VAAVVEPIERKLEPEGKGVGRPALPAPGLETGVLAAASAVEGPLAHAAGRLARQLVPAGAGRGRHLLEVGPPRDTGGPARAKVAGGAPAGPGEGEGDHRQHGVEGAEEGQVRHVPDELG
jgi:hypothetical protein